MVCTIPASAWTWLVRPRKASAVTMNGAGFDAGEGNPGSVIILQKRLGVGTAVATSSVGRGWSGRLYVHWRPPYFRPASCLHRVGHVGGPTVRGYDNVTMVPVLLVDLVLTIARSYAIETDLSPSSKGVA
ncbi:hypothetical protein B296_00039186 [Ensete ventricosum]|uniref:Uncharacterized protein n=1 Tax=Ensete ventricosum TaxID=4639 RepID=A0A426X1L3_ENSVE|nr:hypothetical protein B296_00039186 [Ensete ventricosum]